MHGVNHTETWLIVESGPGHLQRWTSCTAKLHNDAVCMMQLTALLCYFVTASLYYFLTATNIFIIGE